jgi:hypothetical protein
VPRLYKEEQMRLREILETVVRRVGVRSETVVGQEGYESGSIGSYVFGSRYQATVGENTAD